MPERPRLLRRTIDLLVEENVMPIESIPRHIGLAPHDIAMLAGLPEGYFQGKPKIVQLARLRSVPCTSDQSMPTEVGTVVPFRPMPKR